MRFSVAFLLQISTIAITALVLNCDTFEIYKIKNPDYPPDAAELEDKLRSPFVHKHNLKEAKSVLNVSMANNGADSFTRLIMDNKRHVDRVTGKPYGIINMLWRKTNIFEDVENSSTKSTVKTTSRTINYIPSMFPTALLPEINKLSSHVLQTSTMSFIEFYYMDEDVSSIPVNAALNHGDSSNSNLYDFKFGVTQSPLFAFDATEPVYKKITYVSKNEEKINTSKAPNFQAMKIMFSINNPLTTNISSLLDTWPNLRKSRLLQNLFYKNTTSTAYENKHDATKTSSKFKQNISENETESVIATCTNSTVANDRVKFFEMYDSNTRMPESDLESEQNPLKINKNELMDDKNLNNKIFQLENVEKQSGAEPNKVRFAKKHVLDNHYINNFHTISLEDFFSSPTKFSLNYTNQESTSESILKSNDFVSRIVPWSNYSFTAVYVYERFHVHCDAAAISPHWLVASASCLSRHREYPRGEERSAFVSYCSEYWWQSELITYVKQTIVHPRYRPKDAIRRHQFNIGVIHVTNSMSSSCMNWAPITIMSHQYLTEEEVSVASAVGWGLDRYDMSYSSADLPRKPLSLYESFIYPNSCPGNAGYRKTKSITQEAVQNVICMSLPPYFGEDKDPIHGSLLLVGGKLIALYLQEERRAFGEQSAQYTAIWRLVPWILEVAHEPEKLDYFL